MGAVQSSRQTIVFETVVGATYAITRREQTFQVHIRQLWKTVFYAGMKDNVFRIPPFRSYQEMTT